MAQACRDIHATSRWAMTGTPIQNRVTDFASLLEYLHIYPFSNPKTFELEIIRPCFGSGDPDTLRFRKLVNYISLCRTKAVIDLPNRENDIIFLDFNSKEREYYDAVKCTTIKKMDEVFNHSPFEPSQRLNALQWLNELRLICNHGLIHLRKITDKVMNQLLDGEQPWNSKTAGMAFETLAKTGQAVCQLCQANFMEGTGEASNSDLPKPSLSKCLTLICGSCIQGGPAGQMVPTCSCTPRCPKVNVSWAPEFPETGSEKQLPSLKSGEVSTKLQALLGSLQSSPKGREKVRTQHVYNHSNAKLEITLQSVVFSYWTSTLDLVEVLLTDASISFTRIDGRLSSDKRDEAIHKFETDNSIQVILVSITCGGTGYNTI